MAAGQVVKIFLNRGKVLNVPWGLHFDVYTNKFKKTWRPGGHKNPLQRLAFALGKKRFLVDKSIQNKINIKKLTIIEQILDYARWAPSGDNTQCWRFEIISDDTFVIHATDTRNNVVYDLNGHSSHLAHGILLETLEIVASKFGITLIIKTDLTDDQQIKFTVLLKKAENLSEHPLVPFIKIRSVQRRAMGTRKLSDREKVELDKCLPVGYSIQWFESFSEKLAIAKLNFCNAKTRLTMKEAFVVHKEIIEWKVQFSETKIPEKALGVDWITARLMQWMFKSWKRIEFANKYLAGTWMPRVQLDFIPSLKSSAHFAILADTKPTTAAEYITAGRVVQKFWLTCTKLGLGFQPEQTPVIFSNYLINDINFTSDKKVIENAKKGRARFEEIVCNSSHTVFLGRIGRSQVATSRSIRLPLDKLIIK